MSWLPALRNGDERVWLPLTEVAAHGIASALLVASSGDCTSAQKTLAETLARDPAFHLWSLLAWTDLVSPKYLVRLTYEDLAAWLIQHGLDHWERADTLLGTPEITADRLAQWRRLQANCAELPASAWESSVTDWIRVATPHGKNPTGSVLPRLLDTRSIADQVPGEHPSCSVDFRLSAFPLATLVRQTNELKQLRDRFSAAVTREKRESLYQLAYGLSHEINNPLSNIVGRAQTLLERNDRPDAQRSLRAIADQAMRAYEMIADLMFVARPPQAIKELIDLPTTIEEICRGYEPTCQSRGVELEFARQNDLPPQQVLMDRHQLSDAILALLRNAMEACAPSGQVLVSLQASDRDWHIDVADNGPGLRPRDRRHAFDPFYSGREAGRGLGMGLSKAARIIERLGGSIEVAPHGPGCRMQLRFPRESA